MHECTILDGWMDLLQSLTKSREIRYKYWHWENNWTKNKMEK